MNNNITERYKQLPLGNICDANNKGGNMDLGIKPIDSKCKMAGPAYTVKCNPGDNLAIHKGILDAPAGSVLVVDAGGYCKCGYFGEIMATACMNKGIVGLVIDGAVRDAADLEALGFPVFSRGINPGGTVKETVGRHGEPIICGGLLVETGDMIIGDRDGVAVVAKQRIEFVLEVAEAIATKEIRVLKELASGKSTAEIYGFEKIL